MSVLSKTFLACARAYTSMGLSHDDLHVPLVPLPVRHRIQALKERIRPFEQEDLAEQLQSRIKGTQKETSFVDEVYSTIPTLHQKRLEQITYLKKQLILNELFSELEWAEENLHKIQEIQDLEPAAKQLFIERISLLKSRIKEKMDVTSLLP